MVARSCPISRLANAVEPGTLRTQMNRREHRERRETVKARTIPRANRVDSQTPTGGILSEGVLAVVEGPGLVVDEFQQLKRSPTSELDPSTAASTPPLRRFRPQQISLARAADIILPAGVWPSALRLRLEEGQQPPCLRFLLFPKPNQHKAARSIVTAEGIHLKCDEERERPLSFFTRIFPWN